MSIFLPRWSVATHSRAHLPRPANLASGIGQPRSVLRPVKLAAPPAKRPFSSWTQKLQRTPIGRITPKRVAVRVSDGMQVPLDSAAVGIPRQTIWLPILFSLGLGGGSLVLAAYAINSQARSALIGVNADPDHPTPSQCNAALRARQQARQQAAQARTDAWESNTRWMPQILRVLLLRTKVMYEESRLTAGPRADQINILMGLVAVWGVWQVPRAQGFMRTWFLHRPVVWSGRLRDQAVNCVTLATSVVSHQSFAHLAFNSIALYSFGTSAYMYLHPQASASSAEYLPTLSNSPHYLAFLLCAGLFSSLSSHLWSNLVRLPRLIRSLTSPARLSTPSALAAHQSILPSLGASGAIYGALTLTALAFPQTSVALIFFPFFGIPIGMGVAGMCALDLVGLIRGWKMFDHVAHLSGALFGVVYYQYGKPFFAWLRRQLGSPVAKKEQFSFWR